MIKRWQGEGDKIATGVTHGKKQEGKLHAAVKRSGNQVGLEKQKKKSQSVRHPNDSETLGEIQLPNS